MDLKPYNTEHLESTLTVDILSKHLNKTFIETGTNMGAGIGVAIMAGFKNIISIDINGEFINKARKKYTSSLIKLIAGDSRIILKDVLKQINHPVTFWLDGHSVGDAPILYELKAIKGHRIKTHTILIDDVRMFNSEEWQNVGHDNIVQHIKDINPNYKITFVDSVSGNNDILIAKI